MIGEYFLTTVSHKNFFYNSVKLFLKLDILKMSKNEKFFFELEFFLTTFLDIFIQIFSKQKIKINKINNEIEYAFIIY